MSSVGTLRNAVYGGSDEAEEIEAGIGEVFKSYRNSELEDIQHNSGNNAEEDRATVGPNPIQKEGVKERLSPCLKNPAFVRTGFFILSNS